MGEWGGALASKVTEAEVDAAAIDLRATLETMLTRVDDSDVATFGGNPSAVLFRPAVPVPVCRICQEPVVGVYATGMVAHVRCVEHYETRRQWQD